jgi:hypothetical protein
MAQIFPPSANTWMRLGFLLLPVGAVGSICLAYALAWSDYETGVGQAPEQPVPFSHEHHVGGLGIDCRYCHAAVEKSSFADLPPAQTCMSCHSQIWTQAAALAPLREGFRAGKPLAWSRVNDLPDFVHFDHSIHAAKGVGCETCHGRVDRMPLTVKAHSLYMKWCLDCHNDPAPNLRPVDAVFSMGWAWPARQDSLARNGGWKDGLTMGRELMRRYHVRTQGMTDCVTCHR